VIRLLVFTFLFFLPVFSAYKDLSGVFLERKANQLNSSSILIEKLDLLSNIKNVEFRIVLEFLPPFHYGNIFHVYEGNSKLLSLIYSPKPANNKRGFIFSVPQNNSSESIFADQDIVSNKPIELIIKLSAEEIIFIHNKNNLVSKSNKNLLTGKDLKIYFGALPNKVELSNFILREFSCNQNNETITDSLLWKFDKFDKNSSYDEFKNCEAKLINATPVVDAHYRWTEHEQIKIPKQIAYGFDYSQNKFYSLNRNSLVEYSFITKELRTINLLNKPPYERGFLIQNPFTNKLLFSWDGGSAEVGELDTNLNWSIINNGNRSTQYFGAQQFINPLDSMLYSFGGYGNYEFKNVLQRYLDDKNTWEIIQTSGITIPPRKPILSNIVSDSLIFIGGGIGSKTGDQTFESKEFADLYKMNLRTFHIIKVADLFELGVDQRLGGLFYDEENKEFYFPIITKLDTVEKIQLYRYEFENNTAIIVGENISIKMENDQMRIIHYLPKSKKVIKISSSSVEDEYINFSFTEIQVPIISEAEFNSYFISRNNSYTFILIAVALVGIIALALVQVRKKKENYSSNSKKYNPRNSIFLLGNFKIFDKTGTNIAPSFSVKVLEAFLLVFINSFKVSNYLSNDGISSVELANFLWQDYDKDSQKNNRNVTINKLRHLLKDVNGLQIIYENSRWKILITKDMFVDILEFTNILEEKKKDDFISFIKKFNMGEAFKDISYEWLDPLKVTLNRFLSDSIISLYRKNQTSFSHYETFQTGKSILGIDELSETGIGLVIRSQKLKGNINGYLQEYELFKKKYFDLTGEIFNKSANDLENVEI
jgi:two-component SAPR family response regulator